MAFAPPPPTDETAVEAAELVERRPVRFVRTHIDAFDAQMTSVGGGIADGSVALLIGHPGASLETFVYQSFFNYIQKEGGKVAYFVSGRSPDDIRSEMRVYGWDISEFEQKGNWMFVDAYTGRVQHLLDTTFGRLRRRREAGRRSLRELALATPGEEIELNPLTILKRELIPLMSEGRWTCVDSLSHILSHVYESKQVLEAIELMIMEARRVGGIHYLLMISGMHDPRLVTAIQHLVDLVLEFDLREERGELTGILKISKARRSVRALRVFLYRIGDRGIEIETAVRRM